MSDLLSLEAQAEAQRLAERQKSRSRENAERSGETLIDLVVDDHETGIGGHELLTLVKRNRSIGLPWNRLRVGSPIVLTAEDDSGGNWQGVVSARKGRSIQVAVNDWDDAPSYRIDLSPDEVTRKRQLAALIEAEQARHRTAELRNVLLGERSPEFADEVDYEFRTELNETQQDAIRFALSAKDIAIIHGPPGTGKTTTVVELICQAVANGDKVLASAPSNTAVDNLLERLVHHNQNVVRIGHPARVDEKLRQHTLDGLLADHDATPLIREMQREAEQLFRKAGRFTRARPARGAKQELRRDARQLKSDARLLEQQVVNEILDQADVVCVTTSFDRDFVGGRKFDLAVIDEACQSTEPGCWIPVLLADRIVLAGDHCQLPPTVLSKPAAGAGLELSMLERLVIRYGDTITRRLGVQYRMHEQIMDFSSLEFYDGSLSAHPSVVSHLLPDLESVTSTDSPLTDKPITFIDTAGSGWDEEIEPDGLSKRNPSEGELILKKAAQLFDAGLPYQDIAIIAPYAAQVRWLRERAVGEIEIDTVDGFQGREKEAVLICTVRSNAENEIGFLSDKRRMNVALTRARRKLIVIGDSATLGSNEFFSSLFEYFESVGSYHSVWEEIES